MQFAWQWSHFLKSREHCTMVLWQRWEAHCGLMAVHRKGKGCGCSCRMRTQRHTRVHHRRIVPSALALATSAAFSMTELWDFKWKLAGASICPLQSCDIQMQPSGSSMTVTGHAGQTHFCPPELAFATKIAFSVAELRDFSWKLAGASACPLHSFEMQGQPLLLNQATLVNTVPQRTL